METRVLEVSSGYAGAKGLRAFLSEFTKVTDRAISSAPLHDLPASLADLVALEIDCAPFDGINLFGPDNVGLLRDIFPREADTFRMCFSATAIDDAYLNYSQTQDSASVHLAPSEWIDQLVVFGEAGNGATLLIANPAIRTSDGEWETWLYDWRLGAYRFLSAAELLGHLYHFHVRRISEEHYRFGREFAPGSGAARLFSIGVDQPFASVPKHTSMFGEVEE